MRSIIFANYIASDTGRLGATVNIENSKVRFLCNLQLNLWDCGGQDWFMENFLKAQRPYIFSNVEVLLYVFDVSSSNEERDLRYYESALKALNEFSPEAKIFVLIHKIDLIKEGQRELVFQDKVAQCQRLTVPLTMTAFKTSIWDETLYKAWSDIVCSLIPNMKEIQTLLNKFCMICEADEVVLFERATFLVLAHSHNKNRENKAILSDPHRFEKVSNVIKQFKLSCLKMQSSHFQSLHVRNKELDAQMDAFTQTTFILVVSSDTSILPATITANINIARNFFEPLF